mmetsp:Transcript_13439/g.40751  ORF Transcript_13439/g.40751 Transcript_13439/m.40751 type:complete len:352 (+) Transcript_13439:1175-2230(+)
MSKSPACMASLASMAALSALHLGRLCVAVLPPEPTWSRLIRRPPGDAGGEGSSWGRPRLSPGRMSGEGGAEQRGTSSTPAGATLEGGPMPVQPMRDRAAARSRCSFVAAHLRMASGELALSRSGGPRASVAPFDPPSAPMAAAASGPILCTSSSTVSASARASCSRWRARLRSSDTIASSGTSSRSCETRGGGWTVARAAPRSASARWNSVAAVPQAVLGSTPCIASISAMSPRGMSGALTPPRPSLSPPDEAGRVNGAAPQPPRAMSPTSPVSTSSRVRTAACASCASCACATDQSSGWSETASSSVHCSNSPRVSVEPVDEPGGRCAMRQHMSATAWPKGLCAAFVEAV